MKIQKDNGYIEDNCYVLESGWQGWYYKDYQAFKDKKGVCYIPEYHGGYDEDMFNDRIPFDEIEKHSYYTYDSIKEMVVEYFKGGNVTDEEIEHICFCIFSWVDWQHCSCLLEEVDWEELILEMREENGKY